MVHCRICLGLNGLLNIWSANNPVEILNEYLSLLVGRYVPTKVIRVRNKDKPWFDDQCRRAFDLKQEAHLRRTRDRSRANWMSLSTVKLELMKPTLRRGISLVLQTGICLSTPSPPISGGPL